MEVVGIRKTSFTAKDSGELIEGVNLYCLVPPDKPGVMAGVMTERLFVTAAKLPPDIKLGDEITVFYNKYGKIEKIL